MILGFLSEDFYKVFSTSCFSHGLCVLVPLAPIEQDHAFSSALFSSTSLSLAFLKHPQQWWMGLVCLKDSHFCHELSACEVERH